MNWWLQLLNIFPNSHSRMRSWSVTKTKSCITFYRVGCVTTWLSLAWVTKKSSILSISPLPFLVPSSQTPADIETVKVTLVVFHFCIVSGCNIFSNRIISLVVSSQGSSGFLFFSTLPQSSFLWYTKITQSLMLFYQCYRWLLSLKQSRIRLHSASL